MAPIGGDAVAELRGRLENMSLHPYRFLDGSEVPWDESPAATGASLERFLVARHGDVARAEAMYVAHLIWRRRVFPISREGAVAAILDDGRRFKRVAIAADGCPVLLVDFRWGYFLGDYSKLEHLRASLVFMEEETERGEREGRPQCAVIGFGGAPPLDFAGALAAVLEANYPERLNRAAVYPVPRVVSAIARAMLGILDPGVASKVALHYDEGQFLQFLRVQLEQLPPSLHGGLPVIERQFLPDSKARMNRTIRTGLWAGRGPAEKLLNEIMRPLEDLPQPPPPRPQRQRPRPLGGTGDLSPSDPPPLDALTSLLFGCCSTREGVPGQDPRTSKARARGAAPAGAPEDSPPSPRPEWLLELERRKRGAAPSASAPAAWLAVATVFLVLASALGDSGGPLSKVVAALLALSALLLVLRR